LNPIEPAPSGAIEPSLNQRRQARLNLFEPYLNQRRQARLNLI
jgi:hypothetical protein